MKTAKQHNAQLTGEIEITELREFSCSAPAAGSIAALYQELIMAVAKKFPGETRHETALRYIRQRENHCNRPCQSNADSNASAIADSVHSFVGNLDIGGCTDG